MTTTAWDSLVPVEFRTAERNAESESTFRSLAERWYAETAFEGSFTRMVMNMNYLRIISLGEAVVPLILRELQKKPAPWFIALEAITGTNPVPDHFAGDFRAMRDLWLEWGASNNFVQA